jgi:hypothetical protein
LAQRPFGQRDLSISGRGSHHLKKGERLVEEKERKNLTPTFRAVLLHQIEEEVSGVLMLGRVLANFLKREEGKQ